MNAYIIVEGDRTELTVYPAWLAILAPHMQKIDDATQVDENNYYLFSAHGIPSIFTHVANAVIDINNINNTAKGRYDFLIVSLDTENETREYIERKIQEKLDEYHVQLDNAQMLIFEQKVCIETWFLGNRVVFKENPQDARLLEFVRFYNVKQDNPEDMGNFDDSEYTTKAQFHYRYLRDIFKERRIKYTKKESGVVCQDCYLRRLIERYEETGHIPTFGLWYEFIKNNL